jgi:chorismate mutase
MARPRRLYYNEKTNKYYYLINGKKVFIKVPAGMSQKQAQTINIKNIIQGDARRLKPKKKRVKAKYTKKLDKGMEKLQPSPFSTGRPTYYQPPISTTILERNIAKSEDTTTNKLLELLLKGAKENIQLPEQPNIPLPTVEITPVKVKPDIEKVAETIKKTYDDAMDFISESKLTQKTPMSIKASPATQAVMDETREQKVREQVFEQIRNKKKRERESDIGLPTNLFSQQTPQQTPQQTTPPQRAPPPITPGTVNTTRTPRTAPPQPPADIDRELIEQFTRQNLGQEAFGEIQPQNPYKPTIDQQYTKEQIEQIARRLNILSQIPHIKRQNKAKFITAIMRIKNQSGKGCKCEKKDDDGLYNDEIEEIMQKRIKNYVPTVAQDKVHTLLQYVNPNDKYFAAVVNTEPSHSSGRHWRCIFIDNRDDFPSAEYFDPLAERSKPEPALLEVMRMIAKKMNPEKYFKFKFNKLQRQSNKTSNCGFHVMQFIEDRVNADDFETASGWKSYMKRKQQGKGIPDTIDGEKNVKPYQEMIEKKFSSYL